MPNFIEQFKKEIEGFKPTSAPANTGTVIRVGDGVAEIEGLKGAVMSEMIKFDVAHGKPLKDALEGADEVFGVILNLEEESVRAIILGDASKI
ncbi:MAG TPA: hypothetical protein VN665_03460, partial [Candidatus Paceibacterota bacterium]|nr:hypothetical protein [Candidatus Paceibacterota bacterium]